MRSMRAGVTGRGVLRGACRDCRCPSARRDRSAAKRPDTDCSVSGISRCDVACGIKWGSGGRRDWAEGVTGLRNMCVEVAMLRTPDGHSRIELSRFVAPQVVAGSPYRPGECARLSARHVCRSGPRPHARPARQAWCGSRRRSDPVRGSLSAVLHPRSRSNPPRACRRTAVVGPAWREGTEVNEYCARSTRRAECATRRGRSVRRQFGVSRARTEAIAHRGEPPRPRGVEHGRRLPYRRRVQSGRHVDDDGTAAS